MYVLSHPDTKIYKPKEELTKMTYQELWDAVTAYKQAKNVVITGGEPMLQKDTLIPLIQSLHQKGMSEFFCL